MAEVEGKFAYVKPVSISIHQVTVVCLTQITRREIITIAAWVFLVLHFRPLSVSRPGPFSNNIYTRVPRGRKSVRIARVEKWRASDGPELMSPIYDRLDR